MKRLAIGLVAAALAASNVAFSQVGSSDDGDYPRYGIRGEANPPDRLPEVADSRPIFATLDEPDVAVGHDRGLRVTSAAGSEPAPAPSRGLTPAPLPVSSTPPLPAGPAATTAQSGTQSDTQPGAQPDAQPGAAAPSLVNQLMEESPRTFGYSGVGQTRSMAPVSGPECESLWYASANAVVMMIDRGDRVALSQTGAPPSLALTTQDATPSWETGWEIRLGRRFADTPYTFEASYWRIDGFRASAETLGASLDAAMPTTGLDFGGTSGDTYFNGAQWQRAFRENEVDNVELNLIRNRLSEADGPWVVDSFFGVRYFRFYDRLMFDSFTQNNTAQATLDHALNNNLIGLQFGMNLGVDLGWNLKLITTPRLGLFGNHVIGRYSAYLGDGTLATGLPISSNEDVFSMIGQIDMSLDWEIHPNWNLFAGYRVLTATGIAKADAQYTINPSDFNEMARIHHDGSLLIHGAVAGLRIAF